MKKIIALGAHYDDVEIGCSGTLKQHSKIEDDVHIVIFNPENDRSGPSETRLIEQQTSLNKLKIPLENLHLVNSLDDDLKYENLVAIVDELKPDILFLPYWNDTHQHHRRVSEIGQSVLRNRNIEGYFYMSGSSIDFKPNVFNKIDQLFKIAVLNSFTSQLKNGSLRSDLIMDSAKYFGSMISEPTYNSNYAEAFYVRRIKYKGV